MSKCNKGGESWKTRVLVMEKDEWLAWNYYNKWKKIPIHWIWHFELYRFSKWNWGTCSLCDSDYSQQKHTS